LFINSTISDSVLAIFHLQVLWKEERSKNE
jgi:hypothetical protein